MNNKAKVLSRTKEISEALANHPIGKGMIDGGLSLIPFLGQFIISALDTRALQLTERNSKRFAEEVKQLMDKLDEDKLDRHFIESDEFVSLLLEILNRNARTYEEEKTKAYARIFVNATTCEKSQVPYKEGFVRMVDEFSSDHIRALSLINSESEHGTKGIPATVVAATLKITTSRAIAFCDQMMRFGLLEDPRIGVYNYERGFYQITGYGKEFAEFLKDYTKHEEPIES